MARFLDEAELGGCIREVLAGRKVRCAVAFWGNGARDALFGSKRAAGSARIICDLSMGGTNPAELELLGAPTNPRLKHVEGLHAKLYLSDAGLVVASANASNRGIGFVEPARLTECGTFHKPGSIAFKDAVKWYERIWLAAADVDDDALTTAKRAWARRPRAGVERGPSPAPADTLLRRIAADPDAHRGIGVVFTSGQADDDDVTEATAIAIRSDDDLETPILSDADRDRLVRWNKGDLFTVWSDAEVSAWPRTFLCAHRGERGAFTYWCYDRFAAARLGDDDWSIFAAPSPELRQRLGIGPKARQAAKPEDELLGRIFALLDEDAEADDGIGHRLCESPIHLARLLARADEAAER